MSASAVLERLTEHGAKLRKELCLPEPTTDPPTEKEIRRLPTRGVDIVLPPELKEFVNQMIEVARTVGPYLGFVMWLVQVVVNRKLARLVKQFEVFTDWVVKLVGERGLGKAEREAVEVRAAAELKKLGLPADKADFGARRVVEIIVGETLAQEPTAEPTVTAPKEFARILDYAKGVQEWQVEEQTYGCLVSVTTAQKCNMRVYIVSKGKNDKGEHEFSFLGICGLADPEKHRDVLIKSGQLPTGSFTLWTLKAQDYYVTQETLRFDRVTLQEVKRVVLSLAEQAEKLRKELKLRG